MANQKSFDILCKELVDRKKFEMESLNRLNEQKCKKCGGNLVKNGISVINGICSECVLLLD